MTCCIKLKNFETSYIKIGSFWGFYLQKYEMFKGYISRERIGVWISRIDFFVLKIQGKCWYAIHVIQSISIFPCMWPLTFKLGTYLGFNLAITIFVFSYPDRMSMCANFGACVTRCTVVMVKSLITIWTICIYKDITFAILILIASYVRLLSRTDGFTRGHPLVRRFSRPKGRQSEGSLVRKLN